MKIEPIKVELIDSMGSDLSVVNAARVSMAKESAWEMREHSHDVHPKYGTTYQVDYTLSERDVKLIAYLATHKHWTPFSHPQVSLRIKAPIFVARQWFKHMVGITRNETSRRYVDDEPSFYFPEVWRARADNVKQGSSSESAFAKLGLVPGYIVDSVQGSLAAYEIMLEDGVAPEQARMVLPQNMHTEWIETASLAAICRSVKLRLDPHAQAETREVAEQIAAIVEPLFPVSWKALMEGEQ